MWVPVWLGWSINRPIFAAHRGTISMGNAVIHQVVSFYSPLPAIGAVN
jgi:hypothetical protein